MLRLVDYEIIRATRLNVLCDYVYTEQIKIHKNTLRCKYSVSYVIEGISRKNTL